MRALTVRRVAGVSLLLLLVFVLGAALVPGPAVACEEDGRIVVREGDERAGAVREVRLRALRARVRRFFGNPARSQRRHSSPVGLIPGTSIPASTPSPRPCLTVSGPRAGGSPI